MATKKTITAAGKTGSALSPKAFAARAVVGAATDGTGEGKRRRAMAKPRCKVGDLAIVRSGKDFPENIGRIVLVLRRAETADCCNLKPGVLTWVVKSEGTPLFGELSDGTRGSDEVWPYDDDALIPLRPNGKARAAEKRMRKPVVKQATPVVDIPPSLAPHLDALRDWVHHGKPPSSRE